MKSQFSHIEMEIHKQAVAGVDWVVAIWHYILLKFFYFTVWLGAVIPIFSKGKLWFHVITISSGGLYILFILEVGIICLLHMNFTVWFFHTVNLFLWWKQCTFEGLYSILCLQGESSSLCWLMKGKQIWRVHNYIVRYV